MREEGPRFEILTFRPESEANLEKGPSSKQARDVVALEKSSTSFAN